MPDDSKDKSIYALLIGVVVGFAGGAYLFSTKNSSIRTKIEEEISHLYKTNLKPNAKEIKEIEKIKKSLTVLLDDLSTRIKKTMDDGKKDK